MAMLDFTEFRRLIETHLQDNFSTCPIKFENVPIKREGLVNWIAVFDKPTFAQSTGFGETSALTGGVLIIQIFTPLDTGTEVSRSIADELAELIGNKELFGIALSVPELHSAPGNNEYFQQNLQIPYLTVLGQEYGGC